MRFLRAAGLGLVCVLCGITAPWCLAQRAPSAPQDYGVTGAPDAAEGAKVLAQFRQGSSLGTYYLEFELRQMPRRGEVTVTQGRLWGGDSPLGQASLLELPSTGERYLILTGRQPEVWKLDAGTGVARMLTQAESLEPLGGTQFSAFLMGLPFVHWSESTYEGLVRLRSRPTHAFRMAPPFGFPVSTARFSTVRLLIDSQFNALNEVQFLDAEGARRSSFIVGELTKVDERWIMRWIDYRDEVSRDKTRFLVKRAAVGIPLPAGLFTPEALAGVIPEVPQDRVRRL